MGLARSHGVLTPYTSFLAAEGLDLNRQDDNFLEALGRIGLLADPPGKGEGRPRQARGGEGEDEEEAGRAESLRRAAPGRGARAAACEEGADSAESAEAFASAEGREGAAAAESADVGGGAEAARAPRPAPEASGRLGEAVETIGGRAFFLKAGVLVEGDLTAGELSGARPVPQLSGAYFRLAKGLPPDCLGWLTRDRPLVFRWEGAVYRIEPLELETSGREASSGKGDCPKARSAAGAAKGAATGARKASGADAKAGAVYNA
jgi:hypothetical protein